MKEGFPEKPYQWFILFGTLAAFSQAVAHLKGWDSSVDFLEGPSVFLLAIGFIAGSRSMRIRFEALGRNKEAALNDPRYVQARRELQLWSIPGVASFASLLAVRLGYNPLLALAVLVVLIAIRPVMNRAMGWTKL